MIIIYSSDDYDPIDLDTFNTDASTGEGQFVLVSLSRPPQATLIFPSSTSAAIAPGEFSTYAESRSYHWQESEIAGYYLIFGFYLVTPLHLQVSQSNLSLTLPILTFLSTTDYGTRAPSAGLSFHLIPDHLI